MGLNQGEIEGAAVMNQCLGFCARIQRFIVFL